MRLSSSALKVDSESLWLKFQAPSTWHRYLLHTYLGSMQQAQQKVRTVCRMVLLDCLALALHRVTVSSRERRQP